MKHNFIYILILAFLSLTTVAQSQQKAENAFVKELNTIITNSKDLDFITYDKKVTIEKPFAIDANGMLSLTVSYLNDDEKVILKIEAKIKNAKEVAYDLYLILDFKTEEVITQKWDANANQFLEESKSNYFHIGTPNSENGQKAQEKLEKLLFKMLKFYNK